VAAQKQPFTVFWTIFTVVFDEPVFLA